MSVLHQVCLSIGSIFSLHFQYGLRGTADPHTTFEGKSSPEPRVFVLWMQIFKFSETGDRQEDSQRPGDVVAVVVCFRVYKAWGLRHPALPQALFKKSCG